MFEIEWNIDKFFKVYKPIFYYSLFLIGLCFVFVCYVGVWNRVAQSTRNFLNNDSFRRCSKYAFRICCFRSTDLVNLKSFSLETLKQFSNLYKNKTSQYNLFQYRNC